MSETTEREAWVIYAGPRIARGNTIVYAYFELSSLDQNSGLTVGDLKLPSLNYSEKLHQHSVVGYIFKVGLAAEKVRFGKNDTYVGFWKNDTDRTRWRALQTAVEAEKAMKKDALTNTMIESLRPIREAYMVSSVAGKRAILAEVMRIVTT